MRPTYRYGQIPQIAIVARTPIASGELLDELQGLTALLDASAEEALTKANGTWDFSVLLSMSRKASQIFLGPARFTNHDCSPNAKVPYL